MLYFDRWKDFKIYFKYNNLSHLLKKNSKNRNNIKPCLPLMIASVKARKNTELNFKNTIVKRPFQLEENQYAEEMLSRKKNSQ